MTNQLLILGGGFGLYGYLPAAIKSDWRVSTLEKYRTTLNSRIELVNLVDQITFVQEENLDLDLYAGIVVARNPVEQLKFVQQASDYKGHYFLEKPLGSTPASSLELLSILQSRSSSFSIAYLFRYQDWYKEIMSRASEDYNISINWIIPHAENESWKTEDSIGGGLLSYYGIHLLSLIVELASEAKNLKVFYKSDVLRIESNESSRIFRIELSRASSPVFEINLSTSGAVYHWSGASPFGSTPIPGFPDPRIPSLAQYLSNSQEQTDSIERLAFERRIQELRETISQVL